MTPFSYFRARTVAEALSLSSAAPDARYLAGGTNLIDLMRETIERPQALIDVTGLSTEITERNDGALMIGAGVKNSALASDRRVRVRYPMLARAILSGASAQIRNMATVAGNVLQRTRCTYFYDDAARCNKRDSGAGCDAIEGFNRNHAVLGTSPACVATHPSDMCVALVALEAVIHLNGPDGARTVPLATFHRLPTDRPDLETDLRRNELIIGIEVPPLSFGAHSAYRKIRDRASYAFAVVSVAAALDVEDGVVRAARIALGGVAPRPWRATAAEAAVIGRPATQTTFRAAAVAEMAGAQSLRDNRFKIELARRAITAVLTDLSGDMA